MNAITNGPSTLASRPAPYARPAAELRTSVGKDSGVYAYRSEANVCRNMATEKPKMMIVAVLNVIPYITPHAAITRATMLISHLRSQRSAMSAATRAPGTAPIEMADDQASECTSEKPFATSSVGTH